MPSAAYAATSPESDDDAVIVLFNARLVEVDVNAAAKCTLGVGVLALVSLSSVPPPPHAASAVVPAIRSKLRSRSKGDGSIVFVA